MRVRGLTCGQSSGPANVAIESPALRSAIAWLIARSKFRVTTERIAPSSIKATATRYPSLGVAFLNRFGFIAATNGAWRPPCLDATRSTSAGRSRGSAHSSLPRTPSATNCVCTSADRSAASGMRVGASIEHPAPMIKAKRASPAATAARIGAKIAPSSGGNGDNFQYLVAVVVDDLDGDLARARERARHG